MGCAVLALVLPGHVISTPSRSSAMQHSGQPTPRAPDFAAQEASADVRQMADWVMGQSDHQGRPFVIVDKVRVSVFVFHPDGKLIGASAALMGSAQGDDSVSGIGEREMSAILPHERTTPAGRFVSQPGRNLQGEDLIWLKHSEGLAIHRLRPGGRQEQRAQRLASSTPQDNRISLGCVVVPVAFYHSVVAPFIGKNLSVVYVLPETLPVQTLFGALDRHLAAGAF